MAAQRIVRAGSSSDSYRHRKLAATLAGFLTMPTSGREPILSLLADIFELERQRDARLPKDDLGRLDMQSVVEEIVFSATRWARQTRAQAAAFALLRKVVELTVQGEYWNTASYALTTLCRYEPKQAEDLLRRFSQFATSSNVMHPGNPSLSQEREFTTALTSKNPKTLQAIESVLAERDAAVAATKLDQNSQAAINDLVQVASRYESSVP